MSRPRRPYANPPGRMPATMIKVLAAELSDQGRMARGKQYWADNAVVDIVIDESVVTAAIQGSRPEVYVVKLITKPGKGVPGKRELRIRCTCPDDGIYDACKHAVAAMFALSDEVAIEPELIDRWRGGADVSERPPTDHAIEDELDDRLDDPFDDGDGLAQVIPIRRSIGEPTSERDRSPVQSVTDPTAEQIAMLLQAPNGAIAPTLPDVSPLSHAGLRDRQLAEVLADALSHLEISWD